MIIIAGLIITSLIFPVATKETVTFTVSDKDRIVTGSGDSVSSKYLIFTNVETFQNSDCMVLGKWNSSDVHGSIKLDTTYEAVVYGYRVPILSWYRNIVSVREIGGTN